MPLEIERKFLVKGSGWRKGQGVRICQGYLNRDKERTVRVRIAGEKAFLTVKGCVSGCVHTEYEYEIPLNQAQELLKMCDGPVLEKIRYGADVKGLHWVIDEFLGENAGLILAEAELQNENQNIDLPDWAGAEVTGDPRYYNSSLIINPFSKW